MLKREELQTEVNTLNDYIKRLELRIKRLEQENHFLEEVNVQIMQTPKPLDESGQK